MTEQIKKLQKEKDKLLIRVAIINNAINAFQQVCEHKQEDGTDAMMYVGHDSHKDLYRCSICYKESCY